MLALERRCLSLLQQQGQQPNYQLLRLLREQGVRRLPPFLLDEGDSEEAAFRRFVANRPHLFEVANGDELRPAQGEQRVPREGRRRALARVCGFPPTQQGLLKWWQSPCPFAVVACTRFPAARGLPALLQSAPLVTLAAQAPLIWRASSSCCWTSCMPAACGAHLSGAAGLESWPVFDLAHACMDVCRPCLAPAYCRMPYSATKFLPLLPPAASCTHL